jgi:hypothetical protein
MIQQAIIHVDGPAAATGRIVVTSDASGFDRLLDVAMLDPTR